MIIIIIIIVTVIIYIAPDSKKAANALNTLTYNALCVSWFLIVKRNMWCAVHTMGDLIK